MTREGDIPIVAIVGWSDSGKTTVVEALVAELGRRGRCVATVKHHPNATDADAPDTDSWRHARAGATVSMLSTPDAIATVEKVDEELSLEALRRRAGSAEILIAEGYSREAPARIEVVRAGASAPPRCSPEELVAIVTSAPAELPDYDDVERFDPEDIEALAAFIEERFLDAGGCPRW